MQKIDLWILNNLHHMHEKLTDAYMKTSSPSVIACKLHQNCFTWLRS